MIEPTTETTDTLAAIAGSYPWPPSIRRRPSLGQLVRWSTVGVRGVVLEVLPVPGCGIVTSHEAITRFLQALAEERMRRYDHRTAGRRERLARRRALEGAADLADARLRANGL